MPEQIINGVRPGDEWAKVVYKHDCFPCKSCEEPICPKCQVHYAECNCPGPSQDDEYEYKGFNGIEYARRIYDAAT